MLVITIYIINNSIALQLIKDGGRCILNKCCSSKLLHVRSATTLLAYLKWVVQNDHSVKKGGHSADSQGHLDESWAEACLTD